MFITWSDTYARYVPSQDSHDEISTDWGMNSMADIFKYFKKKMYFDFMGYAKR